MSDPITLLASTLGANWPALDRARSEARRIRDALEPRVKLTTGADVSFVVFGSLARAEFTQGSDIDWTLLVDGQANPGHLDPAFEARQAVADIAAAPGREGTFGSLAFSHDIVHQIGGNDDTNKNLTQRTLLLLESRAIGASDAYERVRKAVIKRYVVEDFGWMHKVHGVPRFLLNDIARYWRTVAVDFAYKRRERQGDGWALRTIKLRMSRKLTFASGLIACFSCASVHDEPDSSPAAPQPLVSHLGDRLRLTPLESVAREALDHEVLLPAARAIFDAYEEFLGLLDDEPKRRHLESLAPADAASDATYQAARELSHRFQSGLDEFFLGEKSPLRALTSKYGVF